MANYNVNVDKFIIGFFGDLPHVSHPVFQMCTGYGDNWKDAIEDVEEMNKEEYPLTGLKPYRLAIVTDNGITLCATKKSLFQIFKQRKCEG